MSRIHSARHPHEVKVKLLFLNTVSFPRFVEPRNPSRRLTYFPVLTLAVIVLTGFWQFLLSHHQLCRKDKPELPSLVRRGGNFIKLMGSPMPRWFLETCSIKDSFPSFNLFPCPCRESKSFILTGEDFVCWPAMVSDRHWRNEWAADMYVR